MVLQFGGFAHRPAVETPEKDTVPLPGSRMEILSGTLVWAKVTG